ncbi:hypothetical protein [Salinicola rhizosphaerae]|uniref:HNH endonuclease n=1 Tax=Salinicola rhizosphaerae TaxID=1443141 RepID=A0ABQ3DRA7_9GAMM|nr:hypothetical protein [Salinicola rhizosphaerae]GHB13029.1 hypothetical protein GCM10009038_08870 [Salinicola rhizosphaerae]
MTDEQIQQSFGPYGALAVSKGLITRERLIELARKYPNSHISFDRENGHYHLHMPSQRSAGVLIRNLNTGHTVTGHGRALLGDKKRSKAVSFKLTEGQHRAILELVGKEESPGQLARRLVSEYLEQHA